MRVLVSGATGLVGRFVVEHLLRHGHEVVAGMRQPVPQGLFSRAVATVPMTLDPDDKDDKSLHAGFEGIDGFVHAAFQHVPGRYRGGEGDDPQGFRRANLDGSRRLFEAARRMGVGRCVFLSSRAVYGNQPPGRILTEDMTPDPASLYGIVKFEAERTLSAMSGGDFVTASLRATGIYGMLPQRTYKWQSLFDNYLSGLPVTDRIGTELHGDDLAAAVLRLLTESPALVSGRVFNASDILTSHRDLLGELQQLTACPHPLPAAMDKSAFPIMDMSRLVSLGWNPGGLPRLRGDLAQWADGLNRS